MTVTALPAKVTATVGTVIDVALPANASTGYVWTVTPSPVADGVEPVVTVGTQTYSAGPEAPGAPGVSHTEITAVSPGETVVVFTYKSPTKKAAAGSAKPLTITVIP